MSDLLFLAPKFGEYFEFIKIKLSNDYRVTYIDTASVISKDPVFYRQCIRNNDLSMIARKQSGYISGELQTACNSNRFQIVFAIMGTYLSAEHVNFIKANAPGAKLILYIWDDWKRITNKDKEELVTLFDKVYSFDPVDCRNKGFKLRPLFYVRNFSTASHKDKDIDVSFLGVKHSDRMERLAEIKTMCERQKLTYDIKLVTGIIDYVKSIIHYKKDKWSVLYPKSVSYKDYLNTLERSRCVIDIQHPSQKGLTMRTIEALAMGCKLITTNDGVQDFKDIPEDMYMIWDGEIDPISFVKFVKKEINSKLPESYSLDKFLQEILS